jgi:hypothetical protein
MLKSLLTFLNEDTPGTYYEYYDVSYRTLWYRMVSMKIPYHLPRHSATCCGKLCHSVSLIWETPKHHKTPPNFFVGSWRNIRVIKWLLLLIEQTSAFLHFWELPTTCDLWQLAEWYEMIQYYIRNYYGGIGTNLYTWKWREIQISGGFSPWLWATESQDYSTNST